VINRKGLLDLKQQHLAHGNVKAGPQPQAGVCGQEAPVPGEGFPFFRTTSTSSSRSDTNGTGKHDCAKHIPLILLPVNISPALPPPKHPPSLWRGANVPKEMRAPPACENLKHLILHPEILCFTEESFGKGSCAASQSAWA